MSGTQIACKFSVIFQQRQLQHLLLRASFGAMPEEVLQLVGKQHESFGTDYITANAIWFAGGGLQKAGMFNPLPMLDDLNNGDLKHVIDFRQIYATLLEKWLEAPHEQVLKRSFDILPIL